MSGGAVISLWLKYKDAINRELWAVVFDIATPPQPRKKSVWTSVLRYSSEPSRGGKGV